ncbi:protocatechuate 3,4-dioxygenase subunit alpha [Kribbella sp. NPDC004536]|uniref:protocatechuate 3,4-dioxygenase subunit alpha n=1 Tax=Kribbella sp. NPDC004536 TaxID=3364106 RepID=UPI00368C8F3D
MPDHIATPGQTVGPFFHYALPFPGDRELVRRGSAGAVRLHGYVFDGAGNGVPDALLELRQADPHSVVPEVEGSLRRDGAAFTGWGRSTTDPTGHYWFSTLEPPDFFAITIFARGLLNRLFTRIYLPEGAPDGSSTMVAAREPDGGLRFDVHLQGERETVFLTYPGHQ